MATALMLIHGFLTDCHDFDNFISIAHANYDKVVMVNIPGHGDDHDYKNFTVDNTIMTINEAYFSIADYEHIDVIGFSMGGALATYLAANYRISRLVLLAPANRYINFAHNIGKLKYYFDYLNTRKQNQEINEMHRSIVEDSKKSRDILNTIKHKVRLHYFLTFMKLIKKINSMVKEINVPTLLIWGDLDQLVPRSTINFTKSRVKNELNIHILPAMTHLMLYSFNHDIIIDLMIDFLQIKIPTGI